MTFPYISEQNSELLISTRHSWSETAYRMVFENLKYVFPTQHYSTAPSPLSVYCDNHRRVINSSARQSSAPTPKAAEDCHADELIPTGHIWQFLDQLLVKSPGCFLYLFLAEYMVFWNIRKNRLETNDSVTVPVTILHSFHSDRPHNIQEHLYWWTIHQQGMIILL